MTPSSELLWVSSLPDLKHAGTYGGIAAAFAYASIREKLFPNEPPVAVKIRERYALLGKQGEGATGVVFAAYDTQLDRKIALKVLRTSVDPAGATHLLREARSLAQINHPNVVHLHDADTYRGEIYLTMEFVEGEPLALWISRTNPSFQKLLDVLLSVGYGLAAVHDQNIIHRDIKPDNILVGSDGRVRVVDFGIAWAEQCSPKRSKDHTVSCLTGTISGDLTYGGAGTPAYMSPEQRDRKYIDFRSDIFSYCVVVWEAFFGVRPLTSEIPLRSAPAFEKVLRRSLATNPVERHPSMASLLAELSRFRSPKRLPRWVRPLAVGVTSGGVFAIALAIAWHFMGEFYCSSLLSLTPEEMLTTFGSIDCCREQNYLAEQHKPDDSQRPAVSEIEYLRHKGNDELSQGHVLSAILTFRIAVERARLVDHPPTRARALYDLSRAYLRSRRIEDARPLIAEISALASDASGNTPATEAAILFFFSNR